MTLTIFIEVFIQMALENEMNNRDQRKVCMRDALYFHKLYIYENLIFLYSLYKSFYWFIERKTGNNR